MRQRLREAAGHHQRRAGQQGPPERLRPPVQQVTPPIYGEANPKFTDFIAPGMIIAIAFAQSIGLTAMSVVMARLEGTQDRYEFFV